ncbi:galactose mutarotase [Paenalkalicoccus suaedae]|uniref:Aldose 1-epimerase n=1 Tax=Paenalkalicoccus suaedae TaxID=2592382 RepID=A0A859FCZ0_9BACI|nr:aldose epimerase family protein [Paenalkalicoccus suaedae]QKS70671.1 galactose mutarotase [Paenalkalicoccus suaedae]
MKQVGRFDGKAVYEYELHNDSGMKVTALNYGATLTGIYTPDRHGEIENVLLKYDDYKKYEKNDGYIGSLVGRTSGRTKHGVFHVDGLRAEVDKNDGNNHLHGGNKGLSHVFWDVEEKGHELIFTYKSPDGEGGYPGNVAIKVTYTLTEKNQFVVTYHATTDTTTPINLTQHAYFRLSGTKTKSILHHELMLNSNYFYTIDSESLPVAKTSVEEHPAFDFRKPKLLKKAIYEKDDQITLASGGIDHPFVLNDGEIAAVLMEKESGRRMTIRTDDEAIVIYTGNMLLEGTKMNTKPVFQHGAICLETQQIPNHIDLVLVKPDEEYKKVTTFTFDTVEDE